LVIFALEMMLCSRYIGLTKPGRRNGRHQIATARIFRYIWADPALREVYLHLCIAAGMDFATCRDSGPFVVRTQIMRILREDHDHPVARLLRLAAHRRLSLDELEQTCIELMDSESRL